MPQRDPKQAKTAGKFKGFFASMAARREAGSAWSEQGCSRWCAEPALPLLTACAAAAVLTVVFARAEFFTLAIAGLMLELSDDCSRSTSWSPSCSRMAVLMGQQRPSLQGSSLEPQLLQQHANAIGIARSLGRSMGCCLPPRFALCTERNPGRSVASSVRSVCILSSMVFCGRGGRHRRSWRRHEARRRPHFAWHIYIHI